MIAARQIAFGKAAGKKEETPAYWGLCFTAEEAGSTVAMQVNKSSAPTVTLETSYDGEIWEPFSVGETTITLPKVGDKIYFRAGSGGNTKFANSVSEYNCFSMMGVVAASGNIMSLLDGENMTDALPGTYCYASMFKGCTSLVNAPELPATTLADNCYASMFNGCTSLAQAPELPATTLAINCYSNMFNRCTSLVQAPELPVTTLANNCYRVMFSYCTSLTQAPELPATTLATFCYYGMFMGCRNIDCIECSFEAFSSATLQWLKGVSSTGTFICPTALGTNETIQRGLSYCPNGWTVINKG